MAGENEYPSQQWQQPPQRSKPSRKKFWFTIAGVLVGLFVLLTVLVAIFGDNEEKKASQRKPVATEAATTIAPTTVPRATAAPTTVPPTTRYVPPPPPSVTYDLTGQGSVSVTMQNASGGTEQFETPLPYHLDLGPAGTFGGLSGFVYISAQLQSSGTVTCEIKKGEQVIQTATSTGQYVIATCSGSV